MKRKIIISPSLICADLCNLEKEVKESVSQESTTRGGVNTGYDPGDI